MITKRCGRCEKDVDVECFSWKDKSRGWKQPWCKPCQKEYKDQHYRDNKQSYIKKASKAREKVWSWWKEYKKAFSCTKCGENHPGCLDFHHTDDNKENGVANLIANGTKQKALLEIEKCICLCSNCHRKLHYEEKNGV